MATTRQLCHLLGAHLWVRVTRHAAHLPHEDDDINAERRRTDEER